MVGEGDVLLPFTHAVVVPLVGRELKSWVYVPVAVSEMACARASGEVAARARPAAMRKAREVFIKGASGGLSAG